MIYIELSKFDLFLLVILGIFLIVITVDLFEDLVIGTIKDHRRKHMMDKNGEVTKHDA